MPNVYFVVQAGREVGDDDRVLLPELAKLGIVPQVVPWTSGLDGISRDDVLVIRAIWDYHLHPAAFARWIDDAARLGRQVVNPTALLAWNQRKTYLREIAARGVRVPETFFYASVAEFLTAPPAFARERDYVVKPIVSASAHGTFRVNATTIRQVVNEFPYDGLLVQEFIPEIAEGEWSLIFIQGEFMHAVKKVATPGEFRVQREFGGQTIAQAPPLAARSEAQRIIGFLPETPVYARIDLVMRGQEPLLMEIELIEPDLFLSTNPRAAQRFAETIAWIAT